jgi:hypothetical protein
MTTSIDGTTGVTFPDLSVQNTAATGFGFKNRIINGAMVIDQRNAGAAVNGSGGTQTYPVDRYYSQLYNTTGNTTGQQSSTAPAGFVRSLKLSVQTADAAVGATDQVWYGQNIEGYNFADMNFGSSNAATFTLSFWIYSNVTGTYCVTFKNSAENRGYTAEYTVNASNTWEKKTITVAGDQSGTWLTTNGTGLKVWFVLMAGSSQQTTANTWNATSGSLATSNQVNFMSSVSNALFITGVQLEKGSTATSFDYRPYGTELALCMRYFQRMGGVTNNFGVQGYQLAGSGVSQTLSLPVQMRASPTAVLPTMTNINTSGLIVNAVSAECALIIAAATANGSLSSLNSGAGFATFSIEL